MAAAATATRPADAGEAGKPSTSQRKQVEVQYRQYRDESDLPLVMSLVDNELSEPYSIFTYRYFLHTWPHLCFLAFDGDHCFGVIICKLEDHRGMSRGYLAMLVVESAYRGLKVGTTLVCRAIACMQSRGCEEVVLEAELSNTGALALYQALGFVREKRLHKYYLNGSDAFRLKLLLALPEEEQRRREEAAELAAARELATMGLAPAFSGGHGTADQNGPDGAAPKGPATAAGAEGAATAGVETEGAVAGSKHIRW